MTMNEGADTRLLNDIRQAQEGLKKIINDLDQAAQFSHDIAIDYLGENNRHNAALYQETAKATIILCRALQALADVTLGRILDTLEET